MTAPVSQRRLIAGVALAGFAGIAAVFWWLCARSNDIAFLPGAPGASWIVPPIAASPDMHQDVALTGTFRCSFQLPEKPETATLAVRAFRVGTVSINGVEVSGLTLDGDAWKRIQQTGVASQLHAGQNIIEVAVTNRLGPPALWLRLDCSSGSLGTDASWEVARTNAAWQPARLASQPMPIVSGSYLDGQTPLPELLRQSWQPVLGFAALATIGVAWNLRRHLVSRRASACPSSQREAESSHIPTGGPSRLLLRRFSTSAATTLILVCLAWTALFVNNLPQLPRLFGFDAEGHEEYIRYIQQQGALPLATAGWQMYQPPLYYVAAAAVLEVSALTTADEASVVLLRALSGLVGLAHCALVFLCLRRLFPNERWKQTAGTLFAGFLPAHLCLSHYVTNETLAATLVTAAIYFCLRVVCVSQGSAETRGAKSETRDALWAGVALGLALLTKFSAVLAAPVMAGVLVWPLIERRNFAPGPWLRRMGVFIAAILLVSGWHFGRVWARFGNPLIGNWDLASGFAWWQLPGYHTTEYYTRFGEVFVRPLFSSLAGFADGIYATLWGDGLASSAAWMAFRPPWNYEFMGMGWVLAGVGTCLVATGFVAGVTRAIRQADSAWILFVGMLAVFACGVIYMSLRVPSYAQVKAFYGLPALLPLTVAMLTGWDWLVKRLCWLRPVLWVWFLTWMLTILVTFWIRPNNPETHVVKAIWALDRGRLEEAAGHYERAVSLNPRHWSLAAGLTEAVRVKPQSPVFRGLLANVLQRQNRIPEAISHYREALRLSPEDPALLNNLAWILATHPEARFRDGAEAVRLAEQACELTRRTEPVVLGSLAAAYAESGRFDDAVTTADQAHALALQTGMVELAEKNAQLIEVYRAGKSWHEAP